MKRIRDDHGLAQAHMETARLAQQKHMVGTVSYTRGHRTGFWDGVEWVLRQQRDWDSLTAGAALAELRKGQESIYYPLFGDDPSIFVDCPGCDTRTLIDARGLCDTCTHDFQGEQA